MNDNNIFKWNPWPEVPAPDNQTVLATVHLKFDNSNNTKVDKIKTCIATFRYGPKGKNGLWFVGDEHFPLPTVGCQVLAWMILPEPYKN